MTADDIVVRVLDAAARDDRAALVQPRAAGRQIYRWTDR